MAKTQNKVQEAIKKQTAPQTPPVVLLFNRTNYIILLSGIALIAAGFLLMLGGKQPPNEWDPKVIYGFRVATLSTIVVVAGLLVVLYSIFRKPRQ